MPRGLPRDFDVQGHQARIKRLLGGAVRPATPEEVAPAPISRKAAKYRNRKQVIDGVTYDSEKEAVNHVKLAALERAGVIRNLRHHVRFALVVRGHHIADYVADHVYLELQGSRWREVVADTKSPATRKLPVYQMKRKLFAALHRLHIVEL
jgi:hypothetical protein